MIKNPEWALDTLHQAQKCQEHYANLHRTDVTFNVGAQVLLSTAHLSTTTTSHKNTKKLQAKYLGPYKIMEVIAPVAYKLDLPPTMRIHPVFHVSLLKAYHDPTSFPHHVVHEWPPPVSIVNNEEWYEVEQVLDKWMWYRCIEYLVKWKGYPDSNNTWEPVSNLDSCKDLVHDFEMCTAGSSE